ncbi:hypothetical protein [Acidovorax sp. GW101-3H11]|uniref:hypothetical protein n=1 Tax=Acidovorax sp. GW101-3H11 TaxID=1813946 RepID=UPI00104227C4|nr:hypothetical protein [Acidovorax sp. GW101-3H11]
MNVDSMAAILTELYPPQNRKDDEPYADLLMDLTELGVNTPMELRQIVKKHLEATLAADKKEVAKRAGKRRGPNDAADRLSKGVYFAHVGLTRKSLVLEYGEPKARAVFEQRMSKKQTAK